jgi:hypothetical protein
MAFLPTALIRIKHKKENTDIKAAYLSSVEGVLAKPGKR